MVLTSYQKFGTLENGIKSVNKYRTAHLDLKGIAEGVVIISKDHESAVGAEEEETPDTEHVQPNGPVLGKMASGQSSLTKFHPTTHVTAFFFSGTLR